MLDGTADGLRATIADWLEDTTLTAAIPDFIVMAEARLNHLLRVFDQEFRATATITGEYLALPPDWGSIREIFISASPNRPLDQLSSGELRRTYPNETVGKPVAYALIARQLQFAPLPDANYPIEIVYLRTLPPLASNSTNWLLTARPDCYLYGALLAAEMRGWNDARLPLLKSAFDETVQEILRNNDQQRWGASPIYPRIKQFA